jgi:hypothetical protein
MPGKIFVSYRRDDAGAEARSIYERLGRTLAEENIFMDVDRLRAGQRFDRELDKALAECDALIAVIGSRWMDLLSECAQRGERDYVREEIAAALRRDIIVIPVTVGREENVPPLPRAEDLPENIRKLVLYHGHNVALESFGRDADCLIATLQSSLRERHPRRRRQAITVAMLSVLTVMGVLLAVGIVAGPGDTVVNRITPLPPMSDPAAKKTAEEAGNRAARPAAAPRPGCGDAPAGTAS